MELSEKWEKNKERRLMEESVSIKKKQSTMSNVTEKSSEINIVSNLWS